MLTYDDVSKKCHFVFERCFAFLKFFKLLSMGDKFKIKNDKGNFTPTPPPAIARSKYIGGNKVN